MPLHSQSVAFCSNGSSWDPQQFGDLAGSWPLRSDAAQLAVAQCGVPCWMPSWQPFTSHLLKFGNAQYGLDLFLCGVSELFRQDGLRFILLASY